MNLQLNQNLTIHDPRIICGVEIAASGMYLPPKIVKSDDLMREFDSKGRYGVPENSISDKVGIIERRVADEADEPSTLAINAAKQAIESAGVTSVDKLVFCGIMKDQEEPATAHKINDHMNLKARDCYDVSDACFGFVRGLQDCIRSIKLGEIETALVVTGEMPSKGAKSFLKQLKSGVDLSVAKGMIGFLTAGDAGGAILLTRSSFNSARGFGRFQTLSNSRLWDKCYYKKNDKGEYVGQMLMGQLTARGRKLGQQLADTVRESSHWRTPDHMLSHNTGKGSFDCLVNFGLAPRENGLRPMKRLEI